MESTALTPAQTAITVSLYEGSYQFFREVFPAEDMYYMEEEGIGIKLLAQVKYRATEESLWATIIEGNIEHRYVFNTTTHELKKSFSWNTTTGETLPVAL